MSKTKSTEKPQSLPAKLRAHPLLALREEMDDLLARCFGAEEGWLAGRLAPSFDLSETDTAIEVTMDLPGVKPDKVDIHLSGNMLTVRGERKEEKEEKGKTYHRVERRTGTFARSITLPCAVNEDEVVAEYKEGVLNVTLPKSEEAKSRRIEVKH